MGNYHNKGKIKAYDAFSEVALPVTLTASEKVNFTLHIIKFSYKDSAYADMKWGGVNMMLDTSPAKVVENDTYSSNIVVPIIRSLSYYRADNIFIYLGLVLIIIISVILTTKFFKCKDAYWSATNTIDLLIGNSPKVLANIITQKIFFICFSIIYVQHSTDFFSDIT